MCCYWKRIKVIVVMAMDYGNIPVEARTRVISPSPYYLFPSFFAGLHCSLVTQDLIYISAQL